MFLERILAFFDFSRLFVAISRHGCRVLATLAVGVLTSCTTSPSVPPPEAPTTVEGRQTLVTARANARWAALLKGDLDAAYKYLSPASRQVLSLEKYKATHRRSTFVEANVEAVACDGDVCRARVLLTYDHRRMKGIISPVVESWLFESGEPWFVN